MCALGVSCLALGPTACTGGDGPATSMDRRSVERTSWLGSSEGWGLLGLPGEGPGALGYRSARDLESPTWAPLDMSGVRSAYPTFGAVWLQFRDGTTGLFDYATGHLLTFDGSGGRSVLVGALDDATAFAVSEDRRTLRAVGDAAPWTISLPGRLDRLLPTGDDRVLAVTRGANGVELLVLDPSVEEPVSRRAVDGVQDMVVTAWGRVLYFLAHDTSSTVRGLTLPELEPKEELELPAPGVALAATPSSHRLYVSTGNALQIFDRLAGRRVGSVSLPAEARELRFGPHGATLLARTSREHVAVVQVGTDSVLGVIPAAWDGHLPVALPGSRLVARVEDELTLHELPSLTRVAHVAGAAGRIWLPVEWQPPRPRPQLARRSVAPERARETDRGEARAAVEAPEDRSRDAVSQGYYAVVLAARTRPGVDSLARWLESVGYPSAVERHRNAMGELWYRGMVGPYGSRARAEQAARSLSSRYGYKPWILTIGEPNGLDADGSADSAGEPTGRPRDTVDASRSRDSPAPDRD